MKTIIENVILSGRFELSDMLKKIDTLWIQGDLTDDEKEMLVSLAREKAAPENSYAPLQDQIDTLYEEVKTLTETVNANALGMAALKEAVEKLGSTVTPAEPEPEEEFKPFKKPTGAHNAYYAGAKILFDGDKYVCVAPQDQPCVWSPIEYPAYWEKVV